jgi:hypothetical protein
MARLRRVPARLPQEGALLDVPPCHESSLQSEDLGVGSWIRRYVNVSESNFHIDRFWLWNGARFVRIREEPAFYRHPGLDLILDELASVRNHKVADLAPDSPSPRFRRVLAKNGETQLDPCGLVV